MVIIERKRKDMLVTLLGLFKKTMKPKIPMAATVIPTDIRSSFFKNAIIIRFQKLYLGLSLKNER